VLTAHVLTHNNADIIDRCLESLESSFPPGFCTLVVGDHGSTDGTRDLCSRRGVRIVDIDPSKDVSAARNKLIKNSTDWQFYLEPWEILASGHDHIYHTVVSGEGHLRFNIIQGDTLDKQVRLWKGAKFVGQVFERVDLDNGPVVGVIAAGDQTTGIRNKGIVDRWCQESPANPDPYYFRACIALGERRFKDFLRDAEYYSFLIRGRPEASRQTTMLWYYQGCIECFRHKRADKALQMCIACLSVRPTMAEFWCLLGDIHYHILHMYDKALEFYENAQVIGSRRRADDDWAMEISKYRDYPAKLAQSCRKIIEASQQLGVPAY
jgi:glycosyltransferase involved in cell wall biosynthesis